MNVSYQIPLARHSEQVAVIEFATTHTLQIEIKTTQLALCALLIAQGSSTIISYLMPEKGWIVQTGVLSMALLLFLHMHGKIRKRMELTNIPTSRNLNLAIIPYAPPSQNSTHLLRLATSNPSVSDPILQIFINNHHRMENWKMIPHPTLFNKE